MRRSYRLAGHALTVLAIVAVAGSRGAAHKPITSPYTFNEDVFPIVRERCGKCHVAGGVAPMSLMTHPESVPWGESVRTELIAGHMPPWRVDTAPSRFRNVSPLSARELNVLLTWASGGTPLGNPERALPVVEPARTWPLGPPDAILPMPAPFTIGADTQDATHEFTVDPALKEARWLRAVDLMPGNAAMVRRATISLAVPAGGDSETHRKLERTAALWLPGDDPVPLERGFGYRLQPGTRVVVRIQYRKTWQNERAEMTDRSSIGLYFAEGPAAEIENIELEPGPGVKEPIVFRQAVSDDVRALAIYPHEALRHAHVRVEALRPDGSREELIAFRPQPGWERRYWFNQPVVLPRGTQIETTAVFNDPEILPPGASLPPAGSTAASPYSASRRGPVLLTLNVVR